MAQVVLDNVRKVYDNGAEAVRGVSLRVPDGAFVVLVGPSGCGKSTTLRLIAGLEDATSGDITIGDRVVNDVPPKDRDIAMVFQNYALYPHMTVRENMSFALKLRRVPRDEINRRVTDTARTLGIDALMDRRPGVLSGGQRQRVALGRAIVREPRAFLFDEPLSNLDARLRVTTRAELKALHQRLKTTTIYVTHDQEEAMTLGDRVVVMCNGEVRQEGAPLEVYARPADRFVAGFVGTPPMNFFEGTVEWRDGAAWFKTAGPALRFPDARATTLRQLAGRVAALGVRPQMFSEGPPGDDTITASARVVEPLGEVMDIRADCAGIPEFIARLPARAGVGPGAALTLRADMARAHVFETGAFGPLLSAGGTAI